MQYVVTKNFKDRLTGKYYGIGSIYTSTDDARAAELERGGYIAPVNTEAATAALQQKEMEQKATQNAEEVAKAHGEIQANAEAKTVVGGKVVSISQVQKAEAAVNANVNQTGIREAHNNNTEAVQAGQVASQQGTHQATATGSATGTVTSSSNQENMKFNQTNVQSGQQELHQEMQNAQNATGGSQSVQGSANQAGYEGNQAQQQQGMEAPKTAAEIEAEEAAKTAQAAAEAKAKGATARAKKENQ